MSDSKKPKEILFKEMLLRALRGLSERKYREAITEPGEGFGISPFSISNRPIEATIEKKRIGDSLESAT